MADGQTMDEQALHAPSYQPPLQATSNQDQAARADELAARLAAVEAQLTAAQAANAPKPLPTPEEAARAALDVRGAGLGVDERIAELYQHLDTIAKHVGV